MNGTIHGFSIPRIYTPSKYPPRQILAWTNWSLTRIGTRILLGGFWYWVGFDPWVGLQLGFVFIGWVGSMHGCVLCLGCIYTVGVVCHGVWFYVGVFLDLGVLKLLGEFWHWVRFIHWVCFWLWVCLPLGVFRFWVRFILGWFIPWVGFKHGMFCDWVGCVWVSFTLGCVLAGWVLCGCDLSGWVLAGCVDSGCDDSVYRL